ncbi:HAD family hydrolase [Flavivirga abyssicola]|uniref:HAD family hydrolase n=1 Tax=Flavivirga abyssicola TaxID=3063533 RepID=UPI0026E0F01E|nr:HAD family hydrolase [Flavivirga sp. MEBiC07777]WVK13818.1 HAD family hydrolase [Flavivirga sp. MEBiC07777]
MEKIKAVIFDLDGTIGDTVPLCILAFRKSIETLINRSVSDEEIIATFGPSEEGTIMALAPNHYEQGVADYLRYYKMFHDICPNPFHGIKELLDSLKEKGVRIAMVTGKGKYSTEISLDKFELKNYFEIIETGHLEGGRKPEGIQTVLDSFNELSNHEVVYVGDAPSDITASKEVGVPVIAAAWSDTVKPERLAELKPDELFCSIDAFANWINLKI